MAKKPTASSRRFVLGEKGALGRVHVGMEAFFEFSFWLAEELEDLVSRHARPVTDTPRNSDRARRISDW